MMLAMPQAETEVKHHFSDGVYARELRIPAGVCLVGALHKTNHFFTVSRVIYAITDTVWTTFHVTEETDVDKIAEQILVPEDVCLG
jgi:hypothetical protein